MKTKSYLILGGLAFLVVVFLVGRWTAPRAIAPQANHNHATDSTEEGTTWTCSMHPQVQQKEPGDCPICGMTLIPLQNSNGADDGPRTLSMSESSRALADIQTTATERRFPEAKIRLVGKLHYDETKVKSLTARFPARIDELFVNFSGVSVKEGQHLARVYSPELLTAQSELLSSHRFDPNSSATRAATEKLRLWDLLPEQIETIIRNNEAKDFFELKAPMSGVVIAKNVHEGDYLKTGQALFQIADLSELWLKLEAYESDLSWLRFGQTVSFTVESYPGTTFDGKINFIDPEIDRKTRTVSIRVNVDNSEKKLKPGMFARAIAHSKIAKAGNVYAPEFANKWISPMHPEIIKDAPGICDICGMELVPAEQLGYIQDPNEQPPLIIPASAVLRTGKRSIVYVEKPDTERPTFEGREIEIGPRAGDVFIVISGLEEGDRVVTNGAFKIDSSLQIQAKPSMMNPEGGVHALGHNHGDSPAPTDHSKHTPQAASNIDQGAVKKLLPKYFELQSALANDSLEDSKKALMSMMEITGHSGSLSEIIHLMLESDSLKAIRNPHFETLSNHLIATVSKSPSAFDGQIYQMHCPMANSDSGADWLQSSDYLLNPYFGAAMLKCGTTKAEF